MLDGDLSDSSSWRANKNGTQSIVIDLGELKSITGTQLWTANDKAIKYQIYVSETIDGRYKKVAKHKGRGVNNQPSTTTFYREGRFVKLKAIGNWPDITEFNVLFEN